MPTRSRINVNYYNEYDKNAAFIRAAFGAIKDYAVE
jgi:hypothetical protein